MTLSTVPQIRLRVSTFLIPSRSSCLRSIHFSTDCRRDRRQRSSDENEAARSATVVVDCEIITMSNRRHINWPALEQQLRTALARYRDGDAGESEALREIDGAIADATRRGGELPPHKMPWESRELATKFLLGGSDGA